MGPVKRLNIVRFGGSEAGYRFENVETSDAALGGVVATATRLPGMDGGLDVYGFAPAPDEVGNVTVSWNLASPNYQEMSRKRDAVLAMKRWGRRPLWYQPYGGEPKRWCSARINNINASENAIRGTTWLQPVKANFQVPEARWHSRPHQVYLGEFTLDGNVALVDQPNMYLDDGAALGGFQLPIARCTAYVKNGTEIGLLNYGDAPAAARVTIMASRPFTGSDGLKAGEPGVMVGAYGSLSLARPGVKVLNDWGDVRHQWRWNGTLGLNERLEVDAEAGSVKWFHYPNFNENAYADFDYVRGRGFITLEPGLNTLAVEGGFDGPFGFLVVDYDDCWY